jgi:hypothetical protein
MSREAENMEPEIFYRGTDKSGVSSQLKGADILSLRHMEPERLSQPLPGGVLVSKSHGNECRDAPAPPLSLVLRPA